MDHSPSLSKTNDSSVAPRRVWNLSLCPSRFAALTRVSVIVYSALYSPGRLVILGGLLSVSVA